MKLAPDDRQDIGVRQGHWQPSEALSDWATATASDIGKRTGRPWWRNGNEMTVIRDGGGGLCDHMRQATEFTPNGQIAPFDTSDC